MRAAKPTKAELEERVEQLEATLEEIHQHLSELLDPDQEGDAEDNTND